MRFYASVGFSECYWPCSSSTTSGLYNLTITYYYDSANGKLNSATDYTPTGYVIKKFIHPSDAWDGTNARRMDKAFPIIRYADILLMYAEALNNPDHDPYRTVGRADLYRIARHSGDPQRPSIRCVTVPVCRACRTAIWQASTTCRS